MGYRTHYELSVSELTEELNQELENAEIIDFYTGDADDCKWYNHEEEIATISQKFPEILFTLNGDGQESRDIWIKYFKNGKVQTCKAKITFDEFDETKLVKVGK